MREVCEPRTLSKNPSRCSRRQRDPSDPWMIIDRTAISNLLSWSGGV